MYLLFELNIKTQQQCRETLKKRLKVEQQPTTTDNNTVGVAVGVSAEEVEDIVAKAVSAATTVV